MTDRHLVAAFAGCGPSLYRSLDTFVTDNTFDVTEASGVGVIDAEKPLANPASVRLGPVQEKPDSKHAQSASSSAHHVRAHCGWPELRLGAVPPRRHQGNRRAVCFI